MEAFLHRLFTARSDFPIWVRYTLTLGLVGIAFFARVMLDDHLRSYPVLLFIPAIFLSSVLFSSTAAVVSWPPRQRPRLLPPTSCRDLHHPLRSRSSCSS
jgi:hypothetical protein